MISTSLTLLDRLQHRDDQDAWRRFVDLYTPLLFEWARRNRIPDGDRTDVVQSVMMLLLKRLPQFAARPDGSFRGWLFTITRNCWRDRCRSLAREPSPAGGISSFDPMDSDAAVADLTEREYRHYLYRRVLRLIEADFPPQTWAVFRQHVLENRPVAQIASENGITPNAVYLTRARILKRLREELAGLIDE